MTLNKHIEGGPYLPALEKGLDTFACAIEKAALAGWNGQLVEDDWHVHPSTIPGRICLCYPQQSLGRVLHLDVFAVIYSHDFARAIWGDRMEEHLKNMVVFDDPMIYLGVNL